MQPTLPNGRRTLPVVAFSLSLSLSLACGLAFALASPVESGVERQGQGHGSLGSRGGHGEKTGADAPKVEIVPEEFDFGSVRQEQKLVHEFSVANTGTADLEIRRISTSCGCTAAITTDRTVAPGASTILRVTLETRKYKGVVERSVSIATNDPGRVHTVRVKAYVEAPE